MKKQVDGLLAEDLWVTSKIGDANLHLTTSVDLRVRPGEIVGVVGESGSGKSVTALGLMGLLPEGLHLTSGSISVGGRHLVRNGADCSVGAERRRGLAMIFQNPMTALNPSHRIGAQIAEAMRQHAPGTGRPESWAEAINLLRRVDIHDPQYTARLYPHQCSGGMQQRIMIAIAVACMPQILIADEPTTALDVTVQKSVMDLLDELREELQLGVLLVSHDIALIGGRADRLYVMYAGEVVEQGRTRDVLLSPNHPYVAALRKATPEYALETGILEAIDGRVPRPDEYLPTCRFEPRCPFAADECLAMHPKLTQNMDGGFDRCIRSQELNLRV